MRTFAAFIFVALAGTAYASRVPSESAPLSIALDEKKVCVVAPTVSGDCADLHPEQMVARLKSSLGESLAGAALVQVPGDNAVALMIVQQPRMGYGPGEVSANKLGADFAEGLGDVSDGPHVERVGKLEDPQGLVVHVTATAGAKESPLFHDAYFVFGDGSMTLFDFSGRTHDAAALAGVASRAMGTLVASSAYQRDPLAPRSPAEAVGKMVGWALPFVLGALFLIFFVRRRRALSRRSSAE